MVDNLNVSREVTHALLNYQNLLLKWNKAINLISRNSEKDIWERHILDSLQLLKYIDFSDIIIDIGSGGGFPGIVLSICGVKNTVLIESDKKKSVFLAQASKLSSNKIIIVDERIDEKFNMNCDILTSRGFSSVTNILGVTEGIKIQKKMLLLKGKNYEKEIIEAQKHWVFDFNLHNSITSGEGKIVEIFNIKKLL
ncbi:MAG: 16S rRNA (guanine(527)-N(7))-methyltransferase RsmG [Rickettsiaceae bacterium]|nr:16S rRNA (guanine(527)-N(7))-methyltransferase RsmG [Rickettsiaceae bacterium]